jgi:hypothetical protein
MLTRTTVVFSCPNESKDRRACKNYEKEIKRKKKNKKKRKRYKDKETRISVDL